LKIDLLEGEDTFQFFKNAWAMGSIQVAADISIQKGQSDPHTIWGRMPILSSTANPKRSSGLAGNLEGN
jgi:hypothetical protein